MNKDLVYQIPIKGFQYLRRDAFNYYVIPSGEEVLIPIYTEYTLTTDIEVIGDLTVEGRLSILDFIYEEVPLAFQEFDDVGGGVSYLGSSSATAWEIAIITETGKDISKRYATVANNPTYTTFATAWAARLTLTYELTEDI